jgi:hypothetical protein
VKDRYVVSDYSEGLCYMLLILLVLSLICKEFGMHFAKFVGLGNAGGSNVPQWYQRQMAVLALPHGKTYRTGNWVLKS